jgi:intracellular septation protein A
MSRARGAALLGLLTLVLLAGVLVLGFGLIDLFVDPDRVIVLDVVVMLVGLFVLGSAGWFCRRVIKRMTQE